MYNTQENNYNKMYDEFVGQSSKTLVSRLGDYNCGSCSNKRNSDYCSC